MFSSLLSTFWLKLLLLTEIYQHKWKFVVSWHTPYHIIVTFFTLCLLVLMFATIAKTGVLRLDFTKCMLKRLLGPYSSKKLNLDGWSFLKIWVNYYLWSNKLNSYSPRCRPDLLNIWSQEILSKFGTIQVIFMHILCLKTCKILWK